jgi:FecR protein
MPFNQSIPVGSPQEQFSRKRSFQMKSASRHILMVGGLALWVVFGFVLTAQAQNREKYIISAKAGGINFVTGNVTVQREGEERQQQLTVKDNLWTGDSVATGAGGRVEVLLNPGSYMRVDENSEFELTDSSLDNLLVTLVKGSAVVEVTGGDGVQHAIGINTPQAQALIIRGGIYRFNALPNGTTEIVVRKGRVVVDKLTPSEVKGGRKVIIGGAYPTEVAKLNKKEQDTLDLWSKDRAETLARANRRLERRTLWSAFYDSGWSDLYLWGQRNPRLGSLGLWVYNGAAGGYCFFPIGPTAWSSPYGHRYGNGFYPYGNPNGWPQTNGGYTQPRGTGYPGTGGVPSGGNGSGNGNGNGGGSTAPTPQPQPQPQPQPMREAPIERPTREYTLQSPNR